jgi:hypothetical protein
MRRTHRPHPSRRGKSALLTTRREASLYRFKCQTADLRTREIARILCGAGYAVLRFLPSKSDRGGRSAGGRISPFACDPCRKDRRALRRSVTAFSFGAGPRFRGAVRLAVRSSAPVPLIGLSRIGASGEQRAQPSASSSRAAHSGHRAEPRRRPSARLRASPAGAAPSPIPEASCRNAPRRGRL